MANQPSSAPPRHFASGKPWQIIPTKVHGMLDYVMGLALIILPFLPGFPHGTGSAAPLVVSTVAGATALLYSLFTNYELGLVRWLHMVVHLYLDCLSGIVLIVAPWAFSFEHQVYLPFVVLGALEVGASIMSKTRPPTLSIAHDNSHTNA